VQGPAKRDPAAELRSALIAALMDLPFINALPDRRMLLALVRRDVVHFPDVQERPEARLHIVDIVLACLAHPGGLRALLAAAETMAPHADGARRARRLIQSATVSSLVPESELERVRDLLRSATRFEVRTLAVVDDRLTTVITAQPSEWPEVFDNLTSLRADQDQPPLALSLIEHLAVCTDESIAGELHGCAEALADRLEVRAELHALRGRLLSPGRGTDPDPRPIQAGTTNFGQLATNIPYGDHEPGTVGVGGGSLTPPAVLATADLAHLSPSLAEDGLGHVGEDPMSRLAAAVLPDVRLPQVWGNIPPRNPNFTGRDGLLRDLHNQLAAERETAVLPRALQGMGGVGKSQVAIEYVHRHRIDFDLIWWIPAEQPGQILSALTDLAQRLDLDVSREAISAVPAVREALSTGSTPYGNWLLVFDNAESLSEVRPYFPTGGAGKILVTSRNPEWAGVAHALEVDVFTRSESKAFLRKRTPELTEADADRLAEALGDLPLAVEQAAAWRVATGMPVGEYLRLLEEKRIELLELGTSPDYELSVAAAWNLSLSKLEQVNRSALQLLQVCSFFAPEPISRDLFAGSPSAPIADPLDATLRDPIELARAIRDVQRYALAKFDHRNSTLQMHRLVQAVLIGRMQPASRAAMRVGAHTLLANGDPSNPRDPRYWSRYLAIRPHADVSGAVESVDPRVRQLLLNMVQFLYFWGDHEGCLELAEKIHELRRNDLGEDHEYTIAVAKWRSWMLVVLGRFPEAAQLNETALTVSRAAFGEGDERTLDTMTRVAIDRRYSGDFAGALELDRATVAVCRREFDEDDPVTLRAALHLGVSLRQVGAFKEAQELDTDTYRRLTQVFGENDETALHVLNNLTMDQREAGDYLGAWQRQEEVYKLFVSVFPSENPAVTRAARNLAVARRKAGDHDGARDLAENALSKFETRYGSTYPDTMAAALNFAVDLRQTRDMLRAHELGEQTLEKYVALFGERHPHTLCARANVAIVQRLLGDKERAQQSNSRTLAVLRESLGPDHPVSLTCATNLASDLHALGDYRAAYELDIETLDASRRTLGEDHPSTLACGLNLALDLHALSRGQEAEKIHADTMQRFRRVLGDRHPATLNAMQSIRADCDLDPLPL
jgi:Effector-associated domain 2/Tetratricopeptide repeat/vWA-MoxR associated protein middle region 0/NB-ARC domain